MRQGWRLCGIPAFQLTRRPPGPPATSPASAEARPGAGRSVSTSSSSPRSRTVRLFFAAISASRGDMPSIALMRVSCAIIPSRTLAARAWTSWMSAACSRSRTVRRTTYWTAGPAVSPFRIRCRGGTAAVRGPRPRGVPWRRGRHRHGPLLRVERSGMIDRINLGPIDCGVSDRRAQDSSSLHFSTLRLSGGAI